MRYRVLFLVVAGLLICSLAYADVPKLINFQGRLTDASGKFVPDGNYSLTFKIYTDSTGGSAKWQEAQLVMVTKGLFNVILGSVTPIPDSIFEYSSSFLGIQVAADPEMIPRQRLSSLGYAYRGAKTDTSSYSMNSDKLDGLHASDFTSPVSDFGRSGVAADLYEGTTTLTDKYVNEIGPEMVTSSSGTAFEGYAYGNSASSMTGIIGTADNSGSGNASGGAFMAYSSGTGSHYGVSGGSYGNSSYPSYGVVGFADNAGSGSVFGGSFTNSANGTGSHYGLRSFSYGNSSSSSYGIYTSAYNYSTGSAYGGYFSTSDTGGGTHYGVRASASGKASATTYGLYSYVDNSSSGDVFAGYFSTSSNGTGWHYGVYSTVGSGSSSPVYGCYSYAVNTSSGDAAGGYFSTSSSGTGVHRAVVGIGSGSSATEVYGSYFAGYSTSSGSALGAYGVAENSSNGNAYGGLFVGNSPGTGMHYGVKAEGYGNSSVLTYGVDALAQNSSSGFVYAGNFTADSSGTGTHTGVNVSSYSRGAASAFGTYCYAQNSSSGNVYGGVFWAANPGTGNKYGVMAYAPIGSGYAGYFSGDMTATGTKSAAVKVDNGDYRLLYAMESPENWFEDFGGGRLQNGVTTIQIDPLFAQTVNTQIEYRVYLTPEGDCRGLYVTDKTANSFEVRELQSGTSNISFSYRIVAKRRGFENLRLAKMRGPTPEQMAAEQAKMQAEFESGKSKPAGLENPELKLVEPRIREDEQKIREENQKLMEERLKMEKEREAERSRMEKEKVNIEVSR